MNLFFIIMYHFSLHFNRPCSLQLTPIERYAMNFLEASLEDICKEELKQAEVTIKPVTKL